ncbi:hypothetical protein MBANPS3_007042 [Mucor bainieri]
MTSSHSDKDMTISSQPFEPGSTMKKRKTAHASSSSSSSSKQAAPTDFEQELEMLNDDMDLDIKLENTEATWGRSAAPSLDPAKDKIGKDPAAAEPV